VVSSAAGVAVTAKPTVKVSDSFGNGIGGVPVVFTLGSAVGTVTGGSAITGADGTATVGGWTISPTPGANTLLATAGGSGLSGNPATFTITGVSGPVASITKVLGDNQSAGVGTAVLLPPSVRIADQFNNLITGQTVTFAVTSGGGTVSGATPASVAGVATAGGWTLGANPGTNTLTATAASFTATFTATGTAGAVFNPIQYSGGAYTGSWTNTTFASTGVGSAQIIVSGSTATVTVSVSGNVLGNAGGVPNTVKAGNFTSTGAAFTGNVPPMGDITGTIDPAGNIVASGVNVPNTTIARWDATGTLTPGALSMSYKVTFASGSTAVGTVDLRRP
jgi:adhesin/invasin